MKIVELVAVGVRLMGIYALWKAFLSTFGWLGSLSTSNAVLPEHLTLIAGIALGWLLLMLGLGALLVRYPLKVAGWLVPGDSDGELSLGQPATDLQFVLISVLGLFITAEALPSLISDGAWVFFAPEASLSRQGELQDQINFVTSGLSVALGLFLVLQARGLTRLVWRLRGREQVPRQ